MADAAAPVAIRLEVVIVPTPAPPEALPDAVKQIDAEPMPVLSAKPNPVPASGVVMEHPVEQRVATFD